LRDFPWGFPESNSDVTSLDSIIYGITDNKSPVHLVGKCRTNYVLQYCTLTLPYWFTFPECVQIRGLLLRSQLLLVRSYIIDRLSSVIIRALTRVILALRSVKEFLMPCYHRHIQCSCVFHGNTGSFCAETSSTYARAEIRSLQTLLPLQTLWSRSHITHLYTWVPVLEPIWCKI